MNHSGAENNRQMEKMKKGLDVGRYDEEKGIKSANEVREEERDAMKWEIER